MKLGKGPDGMIFSEQINSDNENYSRSVSVI